MKRTLRTFAIVAAFALIVAGCASMAPTTPGSASTPGTQGAAASLTPAQVIQIACPPIQAAIVQFEGLDATLGLTNPAAAKAGKLLTKIAPDVAAACTVGSTVTALTVQNFAANVLPAISQAAGALPLTPAQLQAVQGGLLAAQVALGVANVVEAQIAAAQAAKAAPGVAAPPAVVVPAQ
jgi:hypothetical protein